MSQDGLHDKGPVTAGMSGRAGERGAVVGLRDDVTGVDRLLPADRTTTIGKDPGSDLVVDDAWVSRRHCVLEWRKAALYVRDLGSRNGTFVDDHRIDCAELSPGAVLTVGGARLVAIGAARASRPTAYERLIGHDPVFRQAVDLARRAATTDCSVLILGETGTGKELIAQCIHEGSRRSRLPFVAVNCGAIPRELIGSELFGHERGAFTGAVAKKRGLFEVADGGTIFLDEIGDMAQSAQAKVLRVLQTGEFTRVGGEKSLRTDCRVVAATNRDLEEMVRAGTFREDLFFRLNVVPIRSPNLSERVDDIPLLVEAFVRECCDENGFGRKPVDEGVLERLKTYDWPGNVRELRNVVERLVIMSDEVIRERDLPPYLGGPRPAGVGRQTGPQPTFDLGRYAGKSLREFREEIEADFIRMKLAELGWNISKTAQVLGIERTNLHKKLRALGIHRSEDSKDE